MKYELPKKLKLNYKTWRCGGKFMQDECSHGLGSTCLQTIFITMDTGLSA